MPGPRTAQATADRPAHVAGLQTPANTVSTAWQMEQQRRSQAGLPVLPAGIPLLLEVDPALDIDKLRHVFGFEIVSEEEPGEKVGFVIVASEDVALGPFLGKLQDFASSITGSGPVASVHGLRPDTSQQQRLERILSDTLLSEWTQLADDATFVYDVSVACAGTWSVPKLRKRGRMKPETYAKKVAQWEHDYSAAYQRWDDLQEERLQILERFVNAYGGSILSVVHDGTQVATLPDSFTVRVEIVGKGLKDLVLNCCYIFEVVEPEEIETPQSVAQADAEARHQVQLLKPDDEAPTVCVIDSGIQERHSWLSEAVDADSSRCYLPGRESEVGDAVRDGGHGTRVAGAVLYGEAIPRSGRVQFPAWIQNARVLDDQCKMPVEMLPATVLRRIVEDLHQGEKPTRIFNQSINSTVPCRLKHMSTWAAEIDRLSYEHDVLIVQSVGNLVEDLTRLVNAGRTYPDYLEEAACRVANPAQSFQALTVGSVAYGTYEDTGWRSLARLEGEPSGFSRAGLGIWKSIKPDVVDYGGDSLVSPGSPPQVGQPAVASELYPELVRATLHGGPAYSRDVVGTSFSTPKVSRIAVALQTQLPERSCLLYRALIAQSARWPAWASSLTAQEQSALLRRVGYGIPDPERATTNSDHRTTFVVDGEELSAGECHVFQVRIPNSLRRPASEFDVRVELTLSYVAEPRRTRRTHRGYLGVWLDWMSSRDGEDPDTFLERALKTANDAPSTGSPLKWTIARRNDWGVLDDVRRGVGTLQKDWVELKSNALPAEFCIAIRGHQGWSRDPEATARYALAVSIESVGQELTVYEPLRVAAEELQAELEIEELATELEIEG